MFFRIVLLLVDMVILEDLFISVSCSLRGIKDLDQLEEAAEGVKLLGLVE